MLQSARSPLPREFFARDADLVAADLLGRYLVKHEADGTVSAGRVVETEAYFGGAGANPRLAERIDMPARLRARLLRDGDSASHAFRGITPRNRGMFREAGHAYVYLIYGFHECLNVVTGSDGVPQAVLIRALAPVEGASTMRTRRSARTRGKAAPPPKTLSDTQLASGPGRLTQALGVTRADNGADLTADGASAGGALYFAHGEPPTTSRVRRGPRIGVVGAESYALRYHVANEPHVSGAKRVVRRTRPKVE